MNDDSVVRWKKLQDPSFLSSLLLSLPSNKNGCFFFFDLKTYFIFFLIVSIYAMYNAMQTLIRKMYKSLEVPL